MKKVLHTIKSSQRAGPTTSQNDQLVNDTGKEAVAKLQAPEVVTI